MYTLFILFSICTVYNQKAVSKVDSGFKQPEISSQAVKIRNKMPSEETGVEHLSATENMRTLHILRCGLC